jgi:hypothetical protein
MPTTVRVAMTRSHPSRLVGYVVTNITAPTQAPPKALLSKKFTQERISKLLCFARINQSGRGVIWIHSLRACACRINDLRWHNDNPFPRGNASAARGRAWLRYAGGSRRSPEAFYLSHLKPRLIFNQQLTGHYFGNCRYAETRNDAHYYDHIPTGLLYVFRQRVPIVIDRMLVRRAVRMPVTDNMTMNSPMGLANREAQVVVAGIPSRRFRSRNKYTLRGKCHRPQHHEEDSNTLKRSPFGKAQCASPQAIKRRRS